ncbi:MAG TPA: TetR/AcrR family transcriptional regulator [Cellulomonas sp.]
MTVDAQRGYAKGRAKRRQIIEQATAMFGEAGYRGATLREIAARCGLSHPGLLHHFPTKESLLLAVLAHRDEVDAEQLGLGQTHGLLGLQRLVDLGLLNASRRGIVELYVVLSAEATAADHPAHDYFVARYADSIAMMARVYREAAQDGALRAGIEPGAAARQLVALMDGLQVQWLLDGSTDMGAALREHVQAQLTVPLPAG